MDKNKDKDKNKDNNNKQAIYSYIIILSTWMVMSIYIANKAYSLPSSIIQSLFTMLWAYMGHVIAHYMSSDFPFNILNPHVLFHHNKSFNLPRYLELFIELLTNLFSFVILIILQYVLNIHILSTSLILFGAFVYIAIHIFDYSIFGDTEHGLHHQLTFCNFSPRVMDILFNTRCKPESDYVPMNRELISTLLVFPIVVFIQNRFNLD